MNEKGYYLAANKDTDPELVERLRLANAKIQQMGVVQQSISRYMQPLQKTPGKPPHHTVTIRSSVIGNPGN